MASQMVSFGRIHCIPLPDPKGTPWPLVPKYDVVRQSQGHAKDTACHCFGTQGASDRVVWTLRNPATLIVKKCIYCVMGLQCSHHILKPMPGILAARKCRFSSRQRKSISGRFKNRQTRNHCLCWPGSNVSQKIFVCLFLLGANVADVRYVTDDADGQLFCYDGCGDGGSRPCVCHGNEWNAELLQQCFVLLTMVTDRLATHRNVPQTGLNSATHSVGANPLCGGHRTI